MKNLFFIIFVFFVGFSKAYSQTSEPDVLRGKIVDADGSPIEAARVRIVSETGRITECRTENLGVFACEGVFNDGFALLIEARDFSILRQNYTKAQDFPVNNVFTLQPAAIKEEVLVTANRTETRLGETAASVVTLSQTEIRETAAPTVDDALRQVAGFSLFRRAGSRYANPTAQGVSLRGTGASGASRALVLHDGVPLNDAFGGWVQWNRVAPIAVERIEVLRGGASSLYGNNSLSGTVNILPRRAADDFAFSAEIYGGTQATASGSAFAGFKKNGWTTDLTAATFQTNGYVTIEEAARGAADARAGARNAVLAWRVGKSFFDDAANIFFRTDYFGEVRANGTGLQTNRTHLRQFVLGGEFISRESRVESRESEVENSNPKSKIQNLKFDWRVYGGTQTYDQIFSAVSLDRNSESLNRVQRVPAQTFGATANASAVFFENQTILVGVETRETRGASDEVGVVNNRATSLSGAGGRERTVGFFVQDFARLGERFVLSASARYDAWRNFAASVQTLALSNNQRSRVAFPTRAESAFSPQIALLFQATGNFSLFAVGAKSFRAPTLNELYRQFRVGNVVTLANENLRAERATNFEAGASFNRRKLYLRGNFFWTRVAAPIANVTLTTTANLITRQRQNAGAIESKGFEIEAQTRIERFDLSAGYLLADARVAQFPANRLLENLFVPQVARHQLTFQTRYARRGWSAALQGRASSRQFDDDLNLFRLEPYFQLDVFAAKRFRENLQIFAAVENVFNRRYSVGRTPVRTVSPPINLRVGLRWN